MHIGEIDTTVSQLFGLPAHPLFAHLAVVAIPLAALLAGVVAVFPRVPRIVKITTLALGGLSVALVPLMESSGEALEDRVTETAAVERHTEMGETLLPWVVGLLIVIVAVLATGWWLHRPVSNGPGSQAAPGRGALGARIVTVGLAVVAIAVAAGTLVQTVRIGHSGAQATWSTPGVSTPNPVQVGPGEQDED